MMSESIRKVIHIPKLKFWGATNMARTEQRCPKLSSTRIYTIKFLGLKIHMNVIAKKKAKHEFQTWNH
jgi:hypothetical protein